MGALLGLGTAKSVKYQDELAALLSLETVRTVRIPGKRGGNAQVRDGGSA